jgi:3-hydroxyisobutyrate dehydrogenase-like beta-hydroxyacid dehydrogenase
MAAAALKAFENAAASGHGDQDMAAVVEPLRQTAV